MMNKRWISLVLLAMTSSASIAFSATQGTVGSSSSGSLLITVGIYDRIRISNLRDISGIFDGVNDFTGSTPVCVYRHGTGTYSLYARGSGAGGSFLLTDGFNQVPFAVSYNDGSNKKDLSAGIVLNSLKGADPASPSCANTGNNGELSVRISSQTLSSVPASNYAGVLTVVVSPE